MRNNNPDEQGIGDTSLWIQQFQGEDSGIPSYENIKFEEESKFIPQPPPQGVLSIGPKTFMPSNPSELENKQVPESEVTIQSESGPTTIPFKPVGVDDIVKGRYKRDLKNFILNNIDKVAGPTDITAGNLGVVGQASVPTDDFLSVFSQSLSGADEETQREMSGFMQGIVSQAGNIRSLTDKVNNNPDDIKSRSELGSLYATLGLNDEARNLLTYSAAKGDAAAMYGLAFLEANDSARYASMPIDKANEEREILVRSYLDDAIKADPKMTQPRIFKASLDIQDGNYKGAEGQIAQVILNQPTNSAAYEMMADLKKKTGDDNAAKFYGSLASVFSVIPDDPYFFDQDLITGKPVKTDYQLEREAQSRYMSSIADAIEMKGIANENLSMSEKLLAFAVNPFAVSLQSTFQTGEHTAHSIRNLAEHLPAALHKSMGGGVPYFNQDGVGDAWLKVAADAAHTYFGMYMLKAPTQDMMWKAMPEPVQKVFFEPITTGLSVAGDLSKLFEGGEAAADDLAKRFGDWAKGVEKSYLSNPDEHPLVGFLNTAASVVLMGAMHKNGPDISALPGQMKISRYLKMPEIQKVISELTIGEVQDYQRLAKSKPSGISQSKWMKIIPSLIEMEVMKKASEGAPEAMKAVYKQRMKDHQSFVESVLGMSERVAEKATGPGREAILTKAGPMDVAEVIVGSRRAQAEKELQSSRESITKKLISGEELSPEEIDSFEKARNQMAPVRANERRAMRRRKFNLGSERAEFLSGAKKAIEKISGRKVVDDLELFIEAANQELPKKFGGDKAVFDTVRKQFVVTKEGNEVARVNLGQVNGFNRSGVSFINPEAAKADTPVHEILAHPAVDKMLEESGMTADQIMEADPSSLNEAGRSLREAFDFIEGTEYFNELSFNDAYKNDTKGNRLYEALVTAVGEEGQKLVTPDLKQRVINFGNKVMSALGLTMDSKIGEITKGVLSKSSTSASPAFSVEPKNYEYVTPAKRDSEGKIPPLQGVPKSSGGFGPDEKIVSIAEKYAEENKIPYKRQAEYVKIDEDRSRRIAEEYEKMKHDPQNPKVKEAYESLIEQTKKQYDALVADGYSFTFFDSKTDPYKGNPWEAVNDLRANKKMAVYGTYDGFGTEGITDSRAFDNPLLGDSGLKWPDQNGVMRAVTYNDLFRAVHDAFGHLLEGAGFRARGEENAWQAHARLFTGPAVGAMTSETRGQNSWLNFGPYGEKNRTAKVEDTVFGEQKVGLMPEWTWKEGLAGDEPSFSVEPSSPAKEYFSEPSEEAEFEIERVRNASGEDGSTFNLDGSSFSGKVISIPILSKNIKQEELTDQAIKDFVAEKSGSIVDSEMVKPGIYRFPDRPEVSIDLNVIVDPSKRDLAVEFARRAGQESVYDMSEGRSIKTGETGENPVNFTDQQFEIIQEALGKGEMPDVFDGKFSIEPGGDTPRKITFTEIEREWSNIETPKGRKVKTVVNLSTGVKLTEEQAAERKSLVDKIKKEAYKASREGFIDYLGRLKSDGTLRGVIPAKVLTKFTKSVMKIKDDDSYRAAVETLSKIIEDKEYAESIDAIQSLKESVASRMKGDKATYGDQTDSVRQLISIDEYSLSDLNAYHEMLSALDSKVPDIKKASELSEIVMRDASEANDWGQQNDLSEFIRGEIGKLAALPSEQERARGVKELFDSLTDKVLGMKEGDDGILRPTKIESIEDYRARSRAMSTISRVLRQASGLDPQSHEDLVRRIEEAQENFDSNDVLGDFKAEVERFKKQIAVEARGYFDVTDLSGLEPEFRDSVSRIFRAGDDVLSKLGVNDLENLRKAAYQLESGFFSPELFKISARVESVKRGSEIAKMLDETYSDRRVARLISKSKPEEIKDILRTGQKSEADVAVLAGKRSPYARFVKGFIERAWTSNESDTRKATKRYWDVAKKMKEDDRSVVGMILSQLDYQYNRPDFADLPAGEKDLYGYLLSQQRRNSAMPIQEVERIYKLAKPYLDEIVHSGADGLMLSGNKKLLYDIIREINQDLYKKNRVAALRRGKIIGTEEMYFKRVDRSEASSRTRFQADLESITDVINAMTSGYTLTSSATKARSSNGLYWREYNPDMVMLKAIREANRDYHLSDEVGVSLNALKYSESNASSQEAKDVSSYLHTMTFEGLRTELSNYASIHQSGGVLGGFWGSMSGTASTIVLADPVSRAIKEVTSNMSKWLLSRGLKPEISAKDYFNAIAFRRSESIQKLIDQLQVPILLNSQRYSVDVGRTGKEGKLKSISQAAGSMFDAWNKRAAFEAEFPAAFKKVSGKEFDDQAFLSDPEYATKNYDQIQEAVNIANMEVERITGPGSSFGSAEVASLFGAGRESGMFKLMAWMQHYNMIESRSLSNNMFDLIYNTNNGRTSAALNLAGLLASQVSYQMTSMIARSFYTGFGVKTYNDLSDEKKKQIDRLFSIEGFRDNLATSGINLTVGKYGNTMKIAVGLLGGFFDNYVKKAGDKELKEKWDQARNSAFDYFYVKPINFGEGFGATTAMDLIDILPIVPVVVSPLLEFLSGKPYLVDDVITKVMSGQDLTNDEEVAAYQAMVVINNFLPAVTQSVFKKDMLYPIQGTVYKWLREQKRESVKENKEQKKAAKGVKIRARRSPKKSSPDPAEPGFDTGAMEPSSSE
jgi:hypothetical protein